MILDCFEHKMQNHFIKIEFEKVANFLDTISDDKDLPRFFTKKWVEVYDQSEKNYNPNKEIRIKTSMLRSDLCHFNYAYIAVKGNITIIKKYLLLLILIDQIIQILMQLMLIMQMIMLLVKKSWLLKIMLHLLIVFQRLMA